MPESSVSCKGCDFWLPCVVEEPNVGPILSDFGFCLKPGSSTWLLRTHKDRFCRNGESRKEELLAH